MWWCFAAAEAAQAEFLRPAFMAYLRARGTEDSEFENAELIFGELVGNVVRHAPGPIAVTVRWNADAPILVIADHGPGFSMHSTLPENMLAESGRGLFLVNIFGRELAVQANPTGGVRVSVILPIRRRAAGRPALTGARADPFDVLSIASSTFAEMAIEQTKHDFA